MRRSWYQTKYFIDFNVGMNWTGITVDKAFGLFLHCEKQGFTFNFYLLVESLV